MKSNFKFCNKYGNKWREGCCNMNIYHTLGGQYLIHGREFPINTVVLILDNGVELFCCNFNMTKDKKIIVTVYNPASKQWVKCKLRNNYTKVMWEYYKKNIKKRNHTKKYKKIKLKDGKVQLHVVIRYQIVCSGRQCILFKGEE
jgi:hypothetical protein